ncbi:MAG: glycosyltransferase family 39 protein [Verrucomicrobiota bacterium]
MTDPFFLAPGLPNASADPNRQTVGGKWSTPLRLLALFVFTMAMSLPGTWTLPLVDRDETFYAEVSREMNERADYIVPYFNGKAWLEKPPLLYWCQAASFRVFGESEFAARFPSVIATALTALVVFGFCSSIYGARVAWRAAICFVLCVQVVLFGRVGITDMPLTLFTTLAFWAAWEMRRGGSRKMWWWCFYLSLAGAALAKGPVAVLPLGTILLFAWLAKIPNLCRSMKFGRGLTVTLLVAGLWLIPVLILTKGRFYEKFFQEQVFSKLFNAQQGHGAASTLTYIASLPFYFVILFVAFLPWAFYLPAACKRMKAQWSQEDRYLATGILLTFCLFSLLKTKLPHYTLPAFPLIACAVAPSIPNRRLFQISAGMIAATLAAGFFLAPLAKQYCVPLQLAASPWLSQDMKTAVADYNEPGFVWYLRGRVKAWPKIINRGNVVEFMNEPGARLCVLPANEAAQIALDPAWKQVTVPGVNVVHGRRIALSMFVKTE